MQQVAVGHSMVGNDVVLWATASMVMIYFYSVSNDSYVVNLNHFVCFFG